MLQFIIHKNNINIHSFLDCKFVCLKIYFDFNDKNSDSTLLDFFLNNNNLQISLFFR